MMSCSLDKDCISVVSINVPINKPEPMFSWMNTEKLAEFQFEVGERVGPFYEMQEEIAKKRNTLGKALEDLLSLKEEIEGMVLYLHFNHKNSYVEPDEYEDVCYYVRMQRLLAYCCDLELLLIDSEANSHQIEQLANRLTSMVHVYLDGCENRILDTLLKLKVPFGVLNRCQAKVLASMYRCIVKKCSKSNYPSSLTYLRCLLVIKMWTSLPDNCDNYEIINSIHIPLKVAQCFVNGICNLNEDVQFNVTEYLLDVLRDPEIEIARYFYCLQRAYHRFKLSSGFDLAHSEDTYCPSSPVIVPLVESLQGVVEVLFLDEWLSFDQSVGLNGFSKPEHKTTKFAFVGVSVIDPLYDGTDSDNLNEDDDASIISFSIDTDYADDETPTVWQFENDEEKQLHLEEEMAIDIKEQCQPTARLEDSMNATFD